MNRILFSFLVISLVVACDEPPQIRQYKIEKSRSDLGDIGKNPIVADARPESASNPSSSVLTRMVVAISEQPDATWFFKFIGPVEAIHEAEEVWKKLLTEISFGEDGNPVWKTPKGWLVGAAKPFRFATLKTSVYGKGEVELSISSLAPNQDLLDNANRWMGQLGKANIELEQLKFETMESAAGELKIFDETGKSANSTMPPKVPAEPKSDLLYDVPDGWTEGQTNSIVKVRLRRQTNGSNKTSPQISVTQLLADANQWIPNAQRWARQVEMDDDEATITSLTESVSIDSIEGQKIRLVPDNEDKKFAMVGAMIVRGELAWFFKLIGDRAKVVECENEFDEFLESFRFE